MYWSTLDTVAYLQLADYGPAVLWERYSHVNEGARLTGGPCLEGWSEVD